MTFFDTLWGDILRTSSYEWIAVISGILYVIFATRKMIICWLFAAISSSLFVYLCFIYQLYIEGGLQLFYVVMAVFGWWTWKKDAQLTQTNDVLDAVEKTSVDIKTWSIQKHLINIVISGILSFILGYIFLNYTDQKNPYVDACTTVFSLAATFMVTQKVLENWIYWIVIDAVSIYLYSSRGLQLTAIFYVIFTILATVAFLSWRKQYKLQQEL